MKKIIIMLCLGLAINTGVSAQEGFGTANPNKDAVIDLSSKNKGLLLPRLALKATNLASPLSTMVAGMMVYNTANSGAGSTAVTSGVYFSDGTNWIRFYDQALIPWNNVSTQTTATNEIQDIYQSGNVGIGVGNSTVLNNRLQINTSAGDPVKTEGLQASPNTIEEKVLVSNPTTGVINWINFSSIKTASYRNTTSQNLTKGATGSLSLADDLKDPLLFTAADAIVSSSFMSIGTNGVFTITDGGLYDVFITANLSISPSDDYFHARSTYEHMAINLNLERLDAAGDWVSIANTRTTLDTRAGDAGSSGVMSLTPLNVAIKLSTGDKIRFVVQRATGNYLLEDNSVPVMKIIADASKGVPFSKNLRMVRLQ